MKYIIDDKKLAYYLDDIRGIKHLGLEVITEVVDRFLKNQKPVKRVATIHKSDCVRRVLILKDFNELGQNRKSQLCDLDNKDFELWVGEK
jgi:hypothetical protein